MAGRTNGRRVYSREDKEVRDLHLNLLGIIMPICLQAVIGWVNQALSAGGYADVVTDLSADMGDGITLIKLVHSLCKTLPPRSGNAASLSTSGPSHGLCSPSHSVQPPPVQLAPSLPTQPLVAQSSPSHLWSVQPLSPLVSPAPPTSGQSSPSHLWSVQPLPSVLSPAVPSYLFSVQTLLPVLSPAPHSLAPPTCALHLCPSHLWLCSVFSTTIAPIL